MCYVGRIHDWNDAKGYGFVEPNGGGERAFVHVEAFERQGRRPSAGDLVSYEVVRDARGRINAVGLRYPAPPARVATRTGRFPRVALAVLSFAVLGLACLLGKLPMPVAAIYTGMSAATFLVYRHDKSAARSGQWRTPEATLHLFALTGGWPGALLAQGVFRHKSGKTSFQVVFWITVLLNGTGLAWLLPLGAA